MKLLGEHPEKGMAVEIDYDELERLGRSFIDWLSENAPMGSNPYTEIAKHGFLMAVVAKNIDETFGGKHGMAVAAIADTAAQFYDVIQARGLDS